jgi:hypothetical protein
MNRFAQLLYGEVLYIFETEMPMEQLSTIFSPKTYWVDVTDKQCDVGDTVTFDNDKCFVFTKKEDTKEQTPSLSERIEVLEDTVNTLMEGGATNG